MVNTTTKLYKNWPAICNVKDDLLRLLVATTDDEEILDGLQRAFPLLFCTEESKLRVPASALREKAREYSMNSWPDGKYTDLDTELLWGEAAEYFNIPIAKAWTSDHRAPPSIREKLIGQQLRGGMKISYRGIDCLVIGIDIDFGKVGETITKTPEIDYLCLAPAQFIDLNA